ncbi:MAG: pseudouridine synthase [Bacteroidota bacterium]|nr:pseudouridine synthase [Bacteroidota bacterium]
MESQFISPYEGLLLGDLSFEFPKNTHAIGRLDKHSEGLLLLTTNKKITALLFQSKVLHKRTYIVQVKHVMAAEALSKLRNGINIRIKGGAYYCTPPCDVQLIQPLTDTCPPPRSIHPNQATSWIQITLTEGKYHQVRKMMAAAGHRCLRLIRVAIEDMLLGDLAPGAIKEVEETIFFDQLKLDRSSIGVVDAA